VIARNQHNAAVEERGRLLRISERRYIAPRLYPADVASEHQKLDAAYV
jgi:hypothetical protein